MPLLAWAERYNTGLSDATPTLVYGDGYWRLTKAARRYTSPDGRAWTQRSDYGTTGISASHHANGRWFVGGTSGRAEYSDDNGATWTTVFPTDTTIRAMHYAAGLWVAAGNSGRISTSADNGATWTARTSGFGSTAITELFHADGLWIAIGGIGKLSTSTDGVTWTLRTTGTTDDLFGAAYAFGKFWVGRGGSGRLLHSTDGVTWSDTGQIQTGGVRGLYLDGGVLYARCTLTWLLRTVDGTTWTAQKIAASGYTLWGMTRTGGALLVVGQSNQAWASTDNGATWAAEAVGAEGSDYLRTGSAGGETVLITSGQRIYSAPDSVAPIYASTPWPVEVLPLLISTPWPVVVAQPTVTTGWPVQISPAPERRAITAWRVAIAAAHHVAAPWSVQVLDAAVVGGLDGAASWAAAPDGKWQAVVWLGADNISARITGVVSVQIEADAARTAEFSFVPAAPLQAMALLGQRVRIAFAQAGGLNAQTIFRGVIDTPSIDLQTGAITCACHDRAQEVWARTARETIDALVGGRWHVAVSGEPEDNFEYMRERIQSVGASWALDANQAPRILPWASPARSVTVRQADVIDGSLAVDLPSREQLRTRIDVRMQYRYPVHRGRGITAQWSQPMSFFLPDLSAVVFKQAYIFPTVGSVEMAASSPPGWDMVNLEIENPRPGTYELGYLIDGQIPAFFIIPYAVAPSLAIGFSGVYSARWQQTVTEDYSIAVVWESLEAQIGGPVSEEIGATLESQFDTPGWGSDPSVEPQINVFGVGDVSQPYYAPGAAPADRDDVLRTLLDRAWVRLWSASRTGRVRFALPCRPDLWLDTGVILESGRVRASGVIVALDHRLDVDAGEASTDVSVAVGMPGATPAALPTWSLPASPYVPALPSLDQLSATIGTYVGGLASSPPFDAETMIGIVTNEDGPEVPGRNYYPVGLTIGWPGLTADDRDPREITAAAVVSVTVPTDLLEIV